MFLILLRLSIGWHMFYEGLTKVESTETAEPFSSEMYLRYATGPLAEEFRGLIPDVNSLEAMDREALYASWEQDLQRFTEHYQFDAKQREAAEMLLAETRAQADAWFEDPEIIQRIVAYRDEISQVYGREAPRPVMAFERERVAEKRAELEATRRELIKPIEDWSTELFTGWSELVDEDRVQTVGPYQSRWDRLDWINAMTMYGLMIVGVCLIFGFLTPLAALGAAGFLLMFYLSQPPLPWLPKAAIAEGTYLWVNKNLIEMLACLVLASTPNGLWFGVDALLFGWIGRRRTAAEPSTTSVTAPVTPAKTTTKTKT
ncbi:hypothetical protein BH23PLA1_BH23PLA1_23620 [soil metagenome]